MVVLIGDSVFSADDRSMEEAVADALSAAGLTLGLAESLTGSSEQARRRRGRQSVVEGIDRLLRVGGEAFAARSARRSCRVRRGRSARMATNARNILGSDVGLALSGVAGPTDQDGKPPGNVFVGLASFRGRCRERGVAPAGGPSACATVRDDLRADFLRRRLTAVADDFDLVVSQSLPGRSQSLPGRSQSLPVVVRA